MKQNILFRSFFVVLLLSLLHRSVYPLLPWTPVIFQLLYLMEFYAVKQTSFLGASVHYVCQNINGPCPLLAICNVLILRRHLNIQPYIKNERISSNNLIQAVKERLIATNQPVGSSFRPSSDTDFANKFEGRKYRRAYPLDKGENNTGCDSDSP